MAIISDETIYDIFKNLSLNQRLEVVSHMSRNGVDINTGRSDQDVSVPLYQALVAKYIIPPVNTNPVMEDAAKEYEDIMQAQELTEGSS